MRPLVVVVLSTFVAAFAPFTDPPELRHPGSYDPRSRIARQVYSDLEPQTGRFITFEYEAEHAEGVVLLDRDTNIADLSCKLPSGDLEVTFTTLQAAASFGDKLHVGGFVTGRERRCQGEEMLIRRVESFSSGGLVVRVHTSAASHHHAFKSASVRLHTNAASKPAGASSTLKERRPPAVNVEAYSGVSDTGRTGTWFHSICKWTSSLVRSTADLVEGAVRDVVAVVKIIATGNYGPVDKTLASYGTSFNYNATTGAADKPITLSSMMACTNCFATADLAIEFLFDVQDYHLLRAGLVATGNLELNVDIALSQYEDPSPSASSSASESASASPSSGIPPSPSPSPGMSSTSSNSPSTSPIPPPEMTWQNQETVATVSGQPLVFFVGDVPFVLSWSIPVKAGYHLEVGATTPLEISVHAQGNARLGIMYENGNTSFLHAHDLVPTANVGDLPGVELQLTFNLIPSFVLEIDYLGYASFAVNAFVEAQAELDDDNSCGTNATEAFKYSLNWGVQATAGGGLDVHFDRWTLFSIALPSLTVFADKWELFNGCVVPSGDAVGLPENMFEIPFAEGTVYKGYQLPGNAPGCPLYPQLNMTLQLIAWNDGTDPLFIASMVWITEEGNATVACITQSAVTGTFENTAFGFSLFLVPNNSTAMEAINYSICTDQHPGFQTDKLLLTVSSDYKRLNATGPCGSTYLERYSVLNATLIAVETGRLFAP